MKIRYEQTNIAVRWRLNYRTTHRHEGIRCEAPDTQIHQHVLFQLELVHRPLTAKHAYVSEKIPVQDLDVITTGGTSRT